MGLNKYCGEVLGEGKHIILLVIMTKSNSPVIRSWSFSEPVPLDCDLHRCCCFFLPCRWERMARGARAVFFPSPTRRVELVGAGYFPSPGELDSDNPQQVRLWVIGFS